MNISAHLFTLFSQNKQSEIRHFIQYSMPTSYTMIDIFAMWMFLENVLSHGVKWGDMVHEATQLLVGWQCRMMVLNMQMIAPDFILSDSIRSMVSLLDLLSLTFHPFAGDSDVPSITLTSFFHNQEEGHSGYGCPMGVEGIHCGLVIE